MAYIPFMMNLTDKPVLVVGGGNEALRITGALLDFEARVRVTAIDICVKLQEISYRRRDLELAEKQYEDADLNGAEIVIAATSDEMLNSHISDMCLALGIPFFSVSDMEESSIIFPETIHREGLVVSIFANGQSPSSMAYLRKHIDAAIPPHYEATTRAMDRYRIRVEAAVPERETREKIFCELLEYGEFHEGNIPEEMVERLIREGTSN